MNLLDMIEHEKTLKENKYKHYELYENLVVTTVRILQYASKDVQLKQIHTMFYENLKYFLITGKKLEHIREEVKEILDKKQVLTRKQIQSLRCNSYEWYELYSLFSKKELIKKI